MAVADAHRENVVVNMVDGEGSDCCYELLSAMASVSDAPSFCFVAER